MADSNMQLLYETAEATGISRASGSLEGILSEITCTVEIVILIVYGVVFCSDFIILHSVTIFNHRSNHLFLVSDMPQLW